MLKAIAVATIRYVIYHLLLMANATC